MKLKQKYAQRKFRKIANKRKHKPIIPDLKMAESIGIIWHPTQRESYNFLKEYFKKNRVIIRGFCVFEEDANPQQNSNTLTQADLTWLGFPKKEKIEDFISINFDVLLNISLKQNLVLDYITMLSEAKFKTGYSQNESNFFDLNINITKNPDPMFLVEQQIFYLSQLNKNK